MTIAPGDVQFSHIMHNSSGGGITYPRPELEQARIDHIAAAFRRLTGRT